MTLADDASIQPVEGDFHGHPTLRLVRVRIGRFALGELAAGSWKVLDDPERRLALASRAGPR